MRIRRHEFESFSTTSLKRRLTSDNTRNFAPHETCENNSASELLESDNVAGGESFGFFRNGGDDAIFFTVGTPPEMYLKIFSN